MHTVHAQLTDEDAEQAIEDDETGREPLPLAIGHRERRLQVRAYNCWAGLLGERQFPDVAGLTADKLAPFGPYAVLLDFTGESDDPAIISIGSALAEECGHSGAIARVSEVPPGSLLARVCQHYDRIRDNAAPTGFEAEFVNAHGATILYRGILLPFSGDDATIDHVLGVINWKELANAQVAGELAAQIGTTFDAHPPLGRPGSDDLVPSDWADGPDPHPGMRRRWSHASTSDLAIEAAFPDGTANDPAPAREGALTRRLRELPARPLAELSAAGDEFALVLARRLPEGGIVLLGEVDEPRLLARAARHLLD